jgi:GxxExxY protein
MSEIETAIDEIARDVYASLGSGHNETVYNRAMQVDLRLRGIKYESEKVLEVKYKEHYVGEGYADLVVGSGDDIVLVELKAATCMLGAPEKQQLRIYKNILGIKKGLLINFPQPERQRKKTKEANATPEIISID